MMDRVEWTKEIEAEAAELRRELAETKMPSRERSHKRAYLECLEILPRLTDAEKEQVRFAILTNAMETGDTDLVTDILSGMAECPCCKRWLGHNRPPDDDSPSPTKAKQTSFEF